MLIKMVFCFDDTVDLKITSGFRKNLSPYFLITCAATAFKILRRDISGSLGKKHIFRGYKRNQSKTENCVGELDANRYVMFFILYLFGFSRFNCWEPSMS